uniref:G protein-coupled receptor n=1 Tax=Ditylenchus dipsaci TaxID=166011 RepID=A0A915ET38_9BILA
MKFETLLIVITTVSCILQIYVIFIVIYVSPRAMKSYRFLIIAYTFWDLLFTFGLGFVVQPEVVNPTFVCIKGLGKYFGPLGGNISVCFCLFCVGEIISAQAYALLYRLAVVLPNKVLSNLILNAKSIVFYNIIFFSFELSIAFCIYYSLATPEVRILLLF